MVFMVCDGEEKVYENFQWLWDLKRSERGWIVDVAKWA